MTRAKKAEPAGVAVEQPAMGGSYARQPDGSLKRVESTEDAAAGADTDLETVDEQPPAGDGETEEQANG